MKIKVGNLTIQEKHNICKKSICSECPLYVHDLRPFILRDVCATSYPADYDLVVDFPEDCVDWDVRLPQGIKDTVLNLMDFDKENEKSEN